jgi:glycosyltransferase involved in cell wall biosynthesis
VIKVVHVIVDLDTGGAETTLYKLLAKTDSSRFTSEVITLTALGPVADKIKALGIPVRALGMKRGSVNPVFLLKLALWLRKSKPDILQTWMYHSDLIGSIAGMLAGVRRIAWNIRHSNLIPEVTKRSTMLTAKTCAFLSSYLPDKIISCSQTAKKVHVKLGYMEKKIEIIPNGFDLEIFKPSIEARKAVRKELEIPEDAFIIGMVGRFDPVKDQQTFVRAAKEFAGKVEDGFFVLCGEEITWDNAELVNWITQAALKDRFRLLGRREDISRLMTSFDVAALTSVTEGFPNVIGEAMCCEVPCTVTDVGDSAYIVGSTGVVVPPNSPEAMAEAWESFYRLEEDKRRQMMKSARQRIREFFGLESSVKMYEELYQAMMDTGAFKNVDRQ